MPHLSRTNGYVIGAIVVTTCADCYKQVQQHIRQLMDEMGPVISSMLEGLLSPRAVFMIGLSVNRRTAAMKHWEDLKGSRLRPKFQEQRRRLWHTTVEAIRALGLKSLPLKVTRVAFWEASVNNKWRSSCLFGPCAFSRL